MKTAIISDIHANLPALEAVFAATRAEVDAYVCLGDIVNYGPWNDECLEMVFGLPQIRVIEGNHEQLFVGATPVAHEIPLVRAFYEKSRTYFSRRDLIEKLPQSMTLGAYECVHTLDGDRRIYPDTPVNVSKSYIIGHTHHQFRTRSGAFEVVNCGSVGQNRKVINLADYGVFDSATDTLELRTARYDVEVFIQELVARNYPRECIDYYRAKPRAA